VVGSLVSERCPDVAPQLYRRPTALGYGEEAELSAGNRPVLSRDGTKGAQDVRVKPVC
jgi:hypothetical protein